MTLPIERKIYIFNTCDTHPTSCGYPDRWVLVRQKHSKHWVTIQALAADKRWADYWMEGPNV